MDEWPSKLRLISVLATTHVFLSRSTEEGWPDENPQKTALEISQVIAHLFEPSIPLPEYCSILFAPTGPIQEIAMAFGLTAAALIERPNLDLKTIGYCPTVVEANLRYLRGNS